jgi:hypothetical protein
MIVQHSEVVLQVRKHLIAEAVRHLPQLVNEAYAREIQILCYQKQRAIEKKFEEYLFA